jgi:hypothetical protein
MEADFSHRLMLGLLALAGLLLLAGCGTRIRDVTANPRYKTAFQPGSVYVLRQSALLEAWNHPTRYALISNSAANLRTPPSECGPWIYYTYDHHRDDDDGQNVQQCPPVSLAQLQAAELKSNHDAFPHRHREYRPINPFHTYHRRQNPWIRTVCPSGTQVRIVAVDLVTKGSRQQLQPRGILLTGPLAGLHVWLGEISYVNPFTHLLQADPMYLGATKSVP